ncbi:hypothetical protein BKA70DRAFT_1249997 [Coprinopsis sp. MPI-PUGE-AT-0042]|nr:hypothetical protein BKA70DRAFT_1249997 [Coprinopsis sp. MPI-PUGE-AT-0042]
MPACRELKIKENETVVLVEIRRCTKAAASGPLDIAYCTDMGKGSEIVDLKNVMCLVGRVQWGGRWAMIDRNKGYQAAPCGSQDFKTPTTPSSSSNSTPALHYTDPPQASSPGFEESQNSYSNSQAFRPISASRTPSPRRIPHKWSPSYTGSYHSRYRKNEMSPSPPERQPRNHQPNFLRRFRDSHRTQDHCYHTFLRPESFMRQVEHQLFLLDLQISSARDALGSLQREREIVSRVLRTGRLPSTIYT